MKLKPDIFNLCVCDFHSVVGRDTDIRRGREKPISHIERMILSFLRQSNTRTRGSVHVTIYRMLHIHLTNRLNITWIGNCFARRMFVRDALKLDGGEVVFSTTRRV